MVCQLNLNQVGRTGGIDVKAENIIDIIGGYKGEGMVCQLNMNQVGRTGGTYVKAEDILDIIDGYKGGDHGVPTQHELGGQDWGNLC